jgi:hypothetical protein
MTARILLCVLPQIVFGAQLRAAQAPPDSLGRPASGLILVETADPGVWSLLDGRVLGRGSLKVDSVPAGTHIVRCIPGSITAWGVPEFVDTVRVRGDDTLRVTYPQPGLLLLETIPPGARVFLGDSLLGSTPMTLPPSARRALGRIALERDGYLPTFLPDHPDNGSFMNVVLELSPNDHFRAIERAESKFSSTAVVLTGSGALLAGVATAWLKIKADGKSEEYLVSPNPGLRSEIDRLDAWGGVSLAVCQGLLVYLAYLLIAE